MRVNEPCISTPVIGPSAFPGCPRPRSSRASEGGVVDLTGDVPLMRHSESRNHVRQSTRHRDARAIARRSEPRPTPFGGAAGGSRPREDRGWRRPAASARHVIRLAPESSRPNAGQAKLTASVQVPAHRDGDIQPPQSLRLRRERPQESHADPDLHAAVHAERRIARRHPAGVDEARDTERVVRRKSADRPAFFEARDPAHRAGIARCGVAAHAALQVAKRELERHPLAPLAGQFETANDDVRRGQA